MSVKIRLQRYGKKGKPYFHIVAADSRAPRDGKYIERLGFYNPNTDPATIDINVDDAIRWLNHGAQPTDTARAILSYRGVLYKNHLLKGVAKGALTEEEAEKRFEAWWQEKTEKVEAKRKSVADMASKTKEERRKAEAEVNKARIAALAAAEAPAEEETAEQATEATDTPTDQSAEAETTAPTEEPKVEEPKAEESKAEEPKAEEPKVEEPKAEEKTEEQPEAKAAEETDKSEETKEAKAEEKPQATEGDDADKADKEDEKK